MGTGKVWLMLAKDKEGEKEREWAETEGTERQAAKEQAEEEQAERGTERDWKGTSREVGKGEIGGGS